MAENSYIEPTQPEEELKAPSEERRSKSKTPNKVAQILSGDFLAKEFIVQNLGFIFFVLLLLLLLVAKGYYVKQLSDNIDRTEQELNDINADYVELKARFLEETQRDNLVDKLKNRGLKEPIAPAYIIRVKE
jgi:hypothetical protein